MVANKNLRFGLKNHTNPIDGNIKHSYINNNNKIFLKKKNVKIINGNNKIINKQKN